MKTYYVYEIYNTLGTVEYVGETTRPKNRFYSHYRRPTGKFYGRQDVAINIVAELTDRKKARDLEGRLKLEYGLEWTEKSRDTNNGKKTGKYNGQKNRSLSIDQAQKIRSLHVTGNYSGQSLAKLYNVSYKCIRNIINNKTYIE